MRFSRIGLVLGGIAVVVLGVGYFTPLGPFAVTALPVGAGVSAQLACGGVFVSGRKLDDVVNHDIARLSPLTKWNKYTLDRENRTVSVSIFGLATRTSLYRPGIGCTLLVDSDAKTLLKQAQGIPVPSTAPRPEPWPKGDAVDLPQNPALDRAVADSFSDDTPAHDIDTRAIIVVQDGRIVAERYAPGFDKDTRLLGWSMSKSATATLVGTFIASGALKLDAPPPVPEWTVAGDPRAKITLRNLLNMSSGLAFNEPYDPGSDSTAMLFDSHDMAGYAASRPLAHPPGTFWAYSSGHREHPLAAGVPEERWHAQIVRGLCAGASLRSRRHDERDVRAGRDRQFRRQLLSLRDGARLGGGSGLSIWTAARSTACASFPKASSISSARRRRPIRARAMADSSGSTASISPACANSRICRPTTAPPKATTTSSSRSSPRAAR